MKIRLGLSIKMLLRILGITALIFYITILLIENHSRKIAHKAAIAASDALLEKQASIINAGITSDFNTIKSLAQISKGDDFLSFSVRNTMLEHQLVQLVEDSSHYSSAWMIQELKHTSNESISSDSLLEIKFRNTANDYVSEEVDTIMKSSLYNKIVDVNADIITDPYKYSITKNITDQKLESRLLTPIRRNMEVIGALGISIELEPYQLLIDSLNSIHDDKISLFSNEGCIISHPDKRLIGLNITTLDTSYLSLINSLKPGESSSLHICDINGNDSLYYLAFSFYVAETNLAWTIISVNTFSAINDKIDELESNLKNIFYFGFAFFALIVLILSLIILKPLKLVNKLVATLAKGDLYSVEPVKIKSNDELGEISASVNTVIKGLVQVTNFAENIGKGNFDYKFDKLSDKDILGSSIVELRNNLLKAKKDEADRIKDEKQLNWTSNGINLFNKILRVDNNNLENLTYEIIKNIVIYLEAHMGGIYLKSDVDEELFDLISFIGFSKEKYSVRSIKAGEGIVGRCALERESIFINDVPNTESPISSGLGKSKPLSLLTVPLVTNINLIGVIEIESFKEIQDHQIKFIEKISEVIASTLSAVKTNDRTTLLLDKSQVQSEELERQEEEIRQNIEEMTATQEEASKRESELKLTISGFKDILMVAEYNLNEILVDVNENYANLYKTTKDKLIGKQYKSDSFMDENGTINHNSFWNDLRAGKEIEKVNSVKIEGDYFQILEKFIPIKDMHNDVMSILCVVFDITDQQKLKQDEASVLDANENEYLGLTIDLEQDLEVIDLTYLKMVYKKDGHEIYKILKLYRDTLPKKVLELKDSNDNRDYLNLKQQIKDLKTKMSYLGLKHIYAKFREVEKILEEEKNFIEISNVLDNIFLLWRDADKDLELLLTNA